jgi:hypothetical protein
METPLLAALPWQRQEFALLLSSRFVATDDGGGITGVEALDSWASPGVGTCITRAVHPHGGRKSGLLVLFGEWGLLMTAC